MDDWERSQAILKTVADVYGWAWYGSTDAAKAFCDAVLTSTASAQLQETVKMGKVAARLNLLDFRKVEKDRVLKTASECARSPFLDIGMDGVNLILYKGGTELFLNDDYRDLLQSAQSTELRNFLLCLPQVNPNMRMRNGNPLITFLLSFRSSFIYMLDNRTPELDVDITTGNGNHLEELVVSKKNHVTNNCKFLEIKSLIRAQQRVRTHLTKIQTELFVYLSKPLPKVLIAIIGEFVYFPAKPQVGINGLTALKTWLGGELYRLVEKRHRQLAGKITGMILELQNHEILELIDSETELDKTVRQAVDLLRAHPDPLENP